MRDGVSLGADLYTPTRPAKGILLTRGPYGRGFMMTLAFAHVFAGQGYTVLFVSSRGTADSEGVFDPMRDEAADGRDIVAWMRKQPWYTGRFATVGGSYLGHTQWALLADPPADLAASVVAMGPHDFSRHFWGSGAFNYDLLGWSQQVADDGAGTNVLKLMIAQASFGRKVAPIIEAIPVLPAADDFFARQQREWLHERLVRPDLNDPFWTPMQHADALDNTVTPTLILAGWQDIFLPQCIRQYSRLHERGVDVALTVGPWTHMQLVLGAQTTMAPESLDWLDAHLAGDRALTRKSPVRVRVTGAEKWLDLPEWPPPDTTTTTLHLHPGQRLDPVIPATTDIDTFQFDPAAPTPAVGGNMIANGGYRDDSRYAAREDTRTYDTDPLREDLTVVGAPALTLAHSTELPDADLFVRISDVDQKGRSRNVSETYQRIIGDHAIVELCLLDIAHTFKAGHRIRLIIAGGSFPQFTRNPGTGGNPLAATELHRNLHTVTLGPGKSSLRLPVLPLQTSEKRRGDDAVQYSRVHPHGVPGAIAENPTNPPLT